MGRVSSRAIVRYTMIVTQRCVDVSICMLILMFVALYRVRMVTTIDYRVPPELSRYSYERLRSLCTGSVGASLRNAQGLLAQLQEELPHLAGCSWRYTERGTLQMAVQCAQPLVRLITATGTHLLAADGQLFSLSGYTDSYVDHLPVLVSEGELLTERELSTMGGWAATVPASLWHTYTIRWYSPARIECTRSVGERDDQIILVVAAGRAVIPATLNLVERLSAAIAEQRIYKHMTKKVGRGARIWRIDMRIPRYAMVSLQRGP